MRPRDRQELKRRTCESQNNRCALCTRAISPYSHGEDRACVVRYNPKGPRIFRNTYAACFKCAGSVGNYDPEIVAAGEVPAPKPRNHGRIWNPETVKQVEIELARLGYRMGKIPPQYGYAPVEKAATIAASVLKRAACAANNQKKKKRPGPHSLNSMSKAERREAKIAQLEFQNHRCVYDGHVMLYEQRDDGRNDPRNASWDHLIPKREGGPDDLDNMVLACLVCNNLRDQMEMSAEEFYEWAHQHPEEIEKAARAYRNTMRTKLRIRRNRTLTPITLT